MSNEDDNYAVSGSDDYTTSISLTFDDEIDGEDNVPPQVAPKSFLGRQLVRFQMGNKWFTTVFSKFQLVLLVLTYLTVKEIILPWIYGVPFFFGILGLIFFLGCLDDWRGWTKRELIGAQTQFSPYWNTVTGYYAVQLNRIEQSISELWDYLDNDRPLSITVLPPETPWPYQSTRHDFRGWTKQYDGGAA